MTFLPAGSLSAKLLRIQLFLMVVAVFVLFLILELDFYHSEHKRLVESLDRLVTVQGKAIETAVWEFDLQRVRELLTEQSRLPFFQSAEVFGKKGELLAFAGDIRQPPRSPDFRLEYPLAHQTESGSRIIGQLVVTVQDEEIRTTLLQHLKINGVILLTLLVALGAGTVYGVRVVVGRPLEAFRKAIERPIEEQIHAPLQWSRDNELGKVLYAYNTMLEARHQAEMAIYQREEALRKAAVQAQESSAEAARFNRLAVDREVRMLELKKKINTLSLELHRPVVFAMTEEDDQNVSPAPSVQSIAPEENEELFSLEAVLKMADMQSLFEDFCSAVGVAAAIIDLDAKILASARWQRVCTDFHRVNPITCARCIESDTELSQQLQEGKNYIIYRCKNGLIDAASPVMVNNRHLANVFIGQFFLTPPDLAVFRAQARSVGFEESAYLSAIAEAPIVDEAKLPFVLGFLARFANLIAIMSMERMEASQVATKLSQGRLAALNLAEDAQKAREELALYQKDLEHQVAKRAEELREAEAHSRLLLDCVDEGIFGEDHEGRVHFINPAALKMVDRVLDEVIGHSFHALAHHSYPDGRPLPLEECSMWRAHVHGESRHVENESLWRKDGSCFPVEYSARPIEREGVVDGSVVTFRDISERRQAEALVQEKMQELEKFTQVAVGRELRMIALKEEINQLCVELGRERPYKIVE